MQRIYDPYVLRRMADGRIFHVNPTMPFEYFLDCFQQEQPFFMVSQIEDGRIAITPNAIVLPQNFLQAGHGPQDLLPRECEYVTIKDSTYPVIVTAHPVNNVNGWLTTFERWVQPFVKRPLAEFLTSSPESMPLDFERKPQLRPKTVEV